MNKVIISIGKACMVFYFVWTLQAYSKPFLEQYLSDKQNVFDVGVHEEDKTDYYLKCGVEHVYGIECQPELVEFLKAKYSHESRVTIVPFAASDQHGVLDFYICSNATTISTLSKHWMKGRFSNFKWDRQISVESVTLDYLISKFGLPDYCKIDVEGHELKVLKGLSAKIPLISFEFTKEFFSESIECMKYLETLGFRSFNLVEGENSEFHFSDWQAKESIIKYVTEFQDELVWGDIYAYYPT